MSDTLIYSNYRKIWIDANGPIPIDSDGRSYEIHHINGDHGDNRLENLDCLKIKNHYKIHYEQGDFGACFKIATRMKMSPKELSHLVSKVQRKKVEEGSHPFLSKNVDPVSREQSSKKMKKTKNSSKWKQTIGVKSSEAQSKTKNSEEWKKTKGVEQSRKQSILRNSEEWKSTSGVQLSKSLKDVFNDSDWKNTIGKEKSSKLKLKSKEQMNRPIVQKIKELQKELKIRLSSGWWKKSDEDLSITLQKLENYNYA